MEVSYATMISMGTLVQRLGRDAQRYQAALAEAVNEAAEWRRIADELKAERDAARAAHTAIKQGLGIQAAIQAGKLLGMVDGEGLRGAAERVIKERDAIRAERDDLRRVFALVHASLGIKQGDHIGDAIEALKKERDDLWQREGIEQKRRIDVEAERDALRAQLDTERERHKQTASILAQYAPQTMQIEPPPEASHDTPAGKETAQAAAGPKPGDVVQLVRVPSEDTVGDTLRQSLEWPWESRWGSVGDRGEIVEAVRTKPGARSVRIMNTGVKVWWPLSCIEIVKGERANT